VQCLVPILYVLIYAVMMIVEKIDNGILKDLHVSISQKTMPTYLPTHLSIYLWTIGWMHECTSCW
jgi:hypothetical protein